MSYLKKLFVFLDRTGSRLLDILISALSLLFLSPIYVFLYFLIKRDSPGPVFYRGDRAGRNGKVFRILKFRTMFEEPKSYAGPRITGLDDPRITPVGKWLRDTKLNELPQFWNVLLGDMSLVGPRPEDPAIVAGWPDKERDIILSVRPGITSPASVIYRDEETLLQTGSVMEDYLRSILPSKLRLDVLYVRNRSLISDLDVIFWTLMVLVPQARRQDVPETQLYWGPFARFLSHDIRWFLADAFVSLFSVTLVAIVWRSITPLHIGWGWAPLVALVIAIIFSLANVFRGVHRIYWKKARAHDALGLAVSTGIAVLFLWLANRFLVTRPAVPGGLFLFTGVLALFGFVTVRYRERILTGIAAPWLNIRRGGPVVGERVLIVGAGNQSEFALWLVRKGDLAQAFNVIGMVDDDPKKQGMRIEGVKVLGTTQDIPGLVAAHDIGLVLYSISNIQPPEKKRILRICEGLDVQLVMLPNVVRIMREHFYFDRQPAEPHDSEDERIPADRLVDWLDQIESLIAAGDLDAAHALINRIRAEHLGFEAVRKDAIQVHR